MSTSLSTQQLAQRTQSQASQRHLLSAQRRHPGPESTAWRAQSTRARPTPWLRRRSRYRTISALHALALVCFPIICDCSLFLAWAYNLHTEDAGIYRVVVVPWPTRLHQFRLCRNEAVAPGEYHFQRAREGPAYTIASKFAPATDANAVGPGEYEPQPDGPTGPAYTMRRKHGSHVRVCKYFLTCAESAAGMIA